MARWKLGKFWNIKNYSRVSEFSRMDRCVLEFFNWRILKTLFFTSMKL